MFSSWRLSAAAAILSLVGVVGLTTVVNAASVVPQASGQTIDCLYTVTSAGNGYPTYVLSSGVFVQNGTLVTGQQYDLIETAALTTDSAGNILLPHYPRDHMWDPVANAAGTALMTMVPGSCAIDSGSQ